MDTQVVEQDQLQKDAENQLQTETQGRVAAEPEGRQPQAATENVAIEPHVDRSHAEGAATVASGHHHDMEQEAVQESSEATVGVPGIFQRPSRGGDPGEAGGDDFEVEMSSPPERKQQPNPHRVAKPPGSAKTDSARC